MYRMGRALHGIDVGGAVPHVAHVVDVWFRRELEHMAHRCSMVSLERVSSGPVWVCVRVILLEYTGLRV